MQVVDRALRHFIYDLIELTFFNNDLHFFEIPYCRVKVWVAKLLLNLSYFVCSLSLLTGECSFQFITEVVPAVLFYELVSLSPVLGCLVYKIAVT